jgi:mono/diheme cytochrome c family protein
MVSGLSLSSRLVAVLPVFLLVCGCSRLPDSAYTLRADAEKLELPEKHKRQIAGYLLMFHGTPANPRMADPDEDAVERALAAHESACEIAESKGDSTSSVAAASRVGQAAYKIAGSDRPGFGRMHLQLGREVYTAQCAGCHGTTGDG